MGDDRSRLRRNLTAVVGIALSALFLGLTFVGIDAHAVTDALTRATWWPLLLCVPVQAVSFWVAAVRSKALLRPLDVYRLRDTLRAFLAYFVANNILPLRLGEFVRADLLARTGAPSFTASMAVLGVERVLDLLFLAGMFVAAVPFTSGKLTTGQVIPSVVVLLGVLILASVWVVRNRDPFLALVKRTTAAFGGGAQRWCVRVASQVVDGLTPLRSPRALAAGVGLTVVYWATMLLNVYLWFVAFDLQLPWMAVPVVLLFVSLGHLIPSAPSGVGTYHFFCAASLQLFGVSQGTAASVALVGHALAVVPLTLVAIPFVMPFIVNAWRRRDTAAAPHVEVIP